MSTSGSGLRSTIPPTHQADAVISQANPVSGTLYDVLATTANVRLIQVTAAATWTVQPTPLQTHITIDGNTLTFSTDNPVSATYYEVLLFAHLGETLGAMQAVNSGVSRTFIIEGKSVQVQAEITGGTVQTLNARVKYAKW